MAYEEIPKAALLPKPGVEFPTYTIIQADGLYPDNELEEQVFAPSPTQSYRLKYLQAYLCPPGTETAKPWSAIPEEIRSEVDGIMVLKAHFSEQDLQLFPRLKVFVRMGVGYDRVDRIALAKRGVTLCNIPDYGTGEIADHALGLTLILRRGILLHHDRQRANPPAPWMYIDASLIARLQQSTFGILGLGRIGTAAALRAKAFGFHVLFHDPYLSNGVDKSLGIERTKDIKELFQRANVLSIHCPCTRETRGIIGFDLLSLLPCGAVLVNTARGEIVDLDSVERCLKDGSLAGVGLDVLPEEPIPADRVHSLIQAYRRKEDWLEGRMVLTCHSAFYSPESSLDIRVKSAETMRDVLINGLKSNIILPDIESVTDFPKYYFAYSFTMAIYHIVLFKLKPNVTAQQIAELKTVGAAMVGVIPGLLKFDCGSPLLVTAHRAKGYDLGLVAVLKKPEDITVYGDHLAHQKLHKLREAISTDTLAYDMEFHT
ncbi:hypothetical protein B7463_g10994, partial [Scytalidium lignicola]